MADNDQGRPKESRLIALVEDDATLTQAIQDMIGTAGCWRLQVFSDGQDARNRLPDLGADLILLDVGLPNLDGVSLYKILRGHSKTKNTPIIVITGSQDWELHRMGLQDGLMLRKPFGMEALLELIRASLPSEQEEG